MAYCVSRLLVLIAIWHDVTGTIYNEFNYLSMLGLKLNHVSKRGLRASTVAQFNSLVP